MLDCLEFGLQYFSVMSGLCKLCALADTQEPARCHTSLLLPHTCSLIPEKHIYSSLLPGWKQLGNSMALIWFMDPTVFSHCFRYSFIGECFKSVCIIKT